MARQARPKITTRKSPKMGTILVFNSNAAMICLSRKTKEETAKLSLTNKQLQHNQFAKGSVQWSAELSVPAAFLRLNRISSLVFFALYTYRKILIKPLPVVWQNATTLFSVINNLQKVQRTKPTLLERSSSLSEMSALLNYLFDFKRF